MSEERCETAKIEKIDLSLFGEEKTLGAHLPFIVQLKGFNRHQRIERRVQQDRGKLPGAVDSRPISQGGIALFDGLSNTPLALNNACIFLPLADPRGISLVDHDLFVASVNQIHRLSLDTKKNSTYTDPWLAYIHSLDTSGGRLLVTSPGFDKILEFDKKSGEITWSWSACEHGYDESAKTHQKVSHKGLDPNQYKSGLGLSPEQRTAFPNSAIYCNDPDSILATLFFHGLVKINKKTGITQPIMNDLNHPHCITRAFPHFVVTDSGNGQFYLLDSTLCPTQVIDLKNLSGKSKEAGSSEWLQQARPFGDGLFIALDSHRATIFIIDLKRKLIRRQPFDENWVIQEILPIKKGLIRPISKVVESFKKTRK